jgi:ssDNA-binding Zn-finger/Zn-ribbon topoisomerase 1
MQAKKALRAETEIQEIRFEKMASCPKCGKTTDLFKLASNPTKFIPRLVEFSESR